MTLDTNKIKEFKGQLEEEKANLENSLSHVGRIAEAPGDWMATPEEQPGPAGNADPDKNVQADYVESFQERVAEENVLETRYAEVLDALKRIENGTYGTCEKGEEMIEEDRLEANPAARTCKEHMNG